MPQETTGSEPAVVFTPAPAFDLLAACHVAVDPSHHGFARDWLDAAVKGAPGEVSEATRLLQALPLSGLELADLFASHWSRQPGEVLKALSETPSERVKAVLLEDTVSTPLPEGAGDAEETARYLINERPWVLKADREAILLAVNDPAGVRDAMVTLGRHLAPAVNSQLEKLGGPYEEATEALKRGYTESGLAPLEYAEREMDKTFVNRGPYRAYYFIPSWFLAPHSLRVWDDERCFVVLGGATRAVRAEEQAEELASLFGLLADKNRLLILNMLAEMPRYGRQMAPRLGLTPATVSHHLDALSQAGLLEVRTAGKMKYFSLSRANLDKALQAFDDFLVNR